MVHVLAWTIYCLSLQGISDNLHSKKWYISATLFIFIMPTAARMGILNKMKMKHQLILLAILFTFGVATAQDIIYTTDGQSIEARNIKNEGLSIRYSLYGTSIMDRSTYMIDLSCVKMIKYEDGHIYNPGAKTESTSTNTEHTLTNIQSQKPNSPDTVIVYANVQPNKQLSSRLFNAYPPYKNPATAFIHSLALPGLGQLYNDEVEKGFLFMGGDVAFITTTAIAYFYGNSTVSIIGLAGSLVLRVVDSIEAATSANIINNGHGYVALYPSLNTTTLTYTDGETNLVPGMTLSLSF